MVTGGVEVEWLPAVVDEEACVVVTVTGLATVRAVPVTTSTGAPDRLDDCPKMTAPDRVLFTSCACWRYPGW